MRRGILLTATAILLTGQVQVRAESLIDFNMDASHPTSASISYAGGVNPLIGSNISVDSLLGLNVPSNDGSSLNLTNGRLNFQTGNLTGSDANHWYFGPGGSISVTTTAAIVPGASNTLLSGSFKSAEVEWFSNKFRVVLASYDNTVDAKLAAYYGLPPGLLWDGNLNLSFNATGAPPYGIESSKVLSGDLATTAAVPEPSSLLLGSLGVLGLALVGYRRRSR